MEQPRLSLRTRSGSASAKHQQIQLRVEDPASRLPRSHPATPDDAPRFPPGSPARLSSCQPWPRADRASSPDEDRCALGGPGLEDLGLDRGWGTPRRDSGFAETCPLTQFALARGLYRLRLAIRRTALQAFGSRRQTSSEPRGGLARRPLCGRRRVRRPSPTPRRRAGASSRSPGLAFTDKGVSTVLRAKLASATPGKEAVSP
jgi:hypothetical protein